MIHCLPVARDAPTPATVESVDGSIWIRSADDVNVVVKKVGTDQMETISIRDTFNAQATIQGRLDTNKAADDQVTRTRNCGQADRRMAEPVVICVWCGACLVLGLAVGESQKNLVPYSRMLQAEDSRCIPYARQRERERESSQFPFRSWLLSHTYSEGNTPTHTHTYTHSASLSAFSISLSMHGATSSCR